MKRRNTHLLNELKCFLQYPSVSAQTKHANDVRRCAGWLAQHLQQIGLEHVNAFPTPRHPIVYADWLHAHNKPTVLIYGHYDVQPVEPLSAWRSPPFAPTIRGDNLYGRGASDDKGQLFAHIKALESLLKINGRLPVNVKCLFEGEEEIGSPNLKPFMRRNHRKLVADVAVMSDTRMLAPDQPALTYALRGGLSLGVELIGPKVDLHSGNFGGAIHNPIHALAEIIARLHDNQGRIAIPEFYERVRSWSQQERDFMRRNGPSDAALLRDAQANYGWGERGYSLYERVTIRPSLNVTGITGGYQGEGVKAIIPARASAKLNFRLVPDQEPGEIEQIVRRHFARLVPPAVKINLRRYLSASPALINRQHPAMQAAATAYRHGFGKSPVYLRSGGTIPIVNLLKSELGIPTVLMGFALPDDRLHGPNEKFYLPNFYRAITTCKHFLEQMQNVPRPQSQQGVLAI